MPTYPVRSNAYDDAAGAPQQTKTPAVLIKHKTTRQYDPNAIARLKEKLGISRNMMESATEAVD